VGPDSLSSGAVAGYGQFSLKLSYLSGYLEKQILYSWDGGWWRTVLSSSSFYCKIKLFLIPRSFPRAEIFRYK